MNQDEAVSALSALAHPHRLSVFRLLVRKGGAGLTAGEVARAIGISPAALSFHLKELDTAGLTRSWREGRFIRYGIDVGGMSELLGFLAEDCCDGRPELCGVLTISAVNIDSKKLPKRTPSR